MNVPEVFLNWGWAVFVGVAGYFVKQQDKKIDATQKLIGKSEETLRIELKEADGRLTKRIDAVEDDATDEMRLQRGHIGKLFDKLEAHAQRSEDRHHELLTAIHTGLAGKQDKP